MHVVLLGYASQVVGPVLYCQLDHNTPVFRSRREQTCGSFASTSGESNQTRSSTKVSARLSDPPSPQPGEYYLAKDYFGATSQAKLKPLRLLFSDARLSEA